MTIDEISKYAKTGSLPADKELTCPERCLFHALKNLYDQFREKKITAEQGDKEKKTALMQFQRDVFEYQRDKELIQHHAKLWGQIELSASAYRKNPTIKNADAFLAAVYSCNGDMPMTLDGKKPSSTARTRNWKGLAKPAAIRATTIWIPAAHAIIRTAYLRKKGRLRDFACGNQITRKTTPLRFSYITVCLRVALPQTRQ